MVTEFGMTDALGLVRYANPAEMGYLTTRVGMRQELGPETAALIDQETRRLIDEAQSMAMDLLRSNRAALDRVAEVLQESEVIVGDEIERIAQEY